MLGVTALINGVAPGESILSIDFRPATGQLYGLSSGNSIYTITPLGGALQVGSGFTTPLSGTQFGFDFNPVIDRIRIVSDSDQNIVANPITGEANIAATTPVAYVPGDTNFGTDPNVVHHAYTNNVLFGTAASTQLYAIDSGLDTLVTQANNAGSLNTVGALELMLTNWVASTFLPQAKLLRHFRQVLWQPIHHRSGTGAATNIGLLPTTFAASGYSRPEPTSIALVTALAGLAMYRRRRFALRNA